MECSRDEALRVREVAENKFKAKDIPGAKKLALRAQNLCPSLEGIAQMITTLDVHIASEASINGERDWYAILNVDASADDEMVKNQYRKLALMLHPDKNKSVGAEAAFQLVSEAWSVLSDKTGRMAYDRKRNVSGNKKQSHTSSNGFFHSRKQKNAAPSNFHQNQPPQGSTFWTSCHNCKMQYEYLRIYVNHNLLCPNCHKPFLAVETANPTNGHNPPVPWTSSQRHHASKDSRHANRQKKSAHSGPGKGSSTLRFGSNVDADHRNFQSVTFTRETGSSAATYSSQSANAVRQASGNVNRGEEIIHNSKRAAACSDGFPPEGGLNYGNMEMPENKRGGIGEDGGAAYTRANFETKEGFEHGSHTHINQIQNINCNYGDHGKFRMHKYGNLKKELSHLDIRSMLVRRGQMLVKKKLAELGSEVCHGSVENGSKKHKEKRKGRMINGEKRTMEAHGDAPNTIEGNVPYKCLKKASGEKSGIVFDQSVQQPVHINVPDPDFHDFDRDRSERCFEPDQVWATYDDEDGMPRLYSIVQKVLSLNPFKIRMSFLTSKSNSELGQLNWVGMGFAKTCGDFRVSRYVVKDSINIFSHRVQSEKGPRGVIKILPKKGETWALYRNWSADWNEHTPDDVIYKYDMVEVIDDQIEEKGVTVTPLIKVAGFKTVFHRHMDENMIRRIPREEMFRFSHQVPSYSLTGMEAANAPVGCRELDPAATPLELLQVITEAKGDEMETSQVDKC